MTTDVLTGSAPLAAYREARRRLVTGPQGPLALVNTEWVTAQPEPHAAQPHAAEPHAAQPQAGQTAWGVPGRWFALAPGESGLRLEASADDGITVDDELVDGSVEVRGKDADAPSSIRFTDTVTGYVIASEEGSYALRVFDSASEGNRHFGSIEAFDYAPEWVVEASFTPLEGGRAVGIEHLKDNGSTRERVVPAEITFTHDGVEVSLSAFIDDGSLLLVFSDATSGDSTYGVGRFLRLAPDALQNGTVTLDFNRAYLPPCAFSYHFNCPMPPAENRLAFAVPAGEKNVLNREGGLLH